MIKSFKNKPTEDLFLSYESSAKLCNDLGLPAHLLRIAKRKLKMINAAHELRDLASPPGNRLEKLTGDRQNQWSIRINEKYRICFEWEDGDAWEVEITDYH